MNNPFRIFKVLTVINTLLLIVVATVTFLFNPAPIVTMTAIFAIAFNLGFALLGLLTNRHVSIYKKIER